MKAEWLSSETALRFARAALVAHCAAWCARLRTSTRAAGGVLPIFDQSNRIEQPYQIALSPTTRAALGIAPCAGVLFPGEIRSTRGNHAGQRNPQGQRQRALYHRPRVQADRG